MNKPNEVTWVFNSRYLPSIGGSLTDAELNERPLPHRVVQLLVDALCHFCKLSTSANSLRDQTLSEDAASIYEVLVRNGITLEIF